MYGITFKFRSFKEVGELSDRGNKNKEYSYLPTCRLRGIRTVRQKTVTFLDSCKGKQHMGKATIQLESKRASTEEAKDAARDREAGARWFRALQGLETED